MKTVVGMMARRMLVNWRIDYETAAACLPRGLKPKRVGDFAIAGLCIVRLESMRPPGIPEWISVNSENVAARMAVEYEGGQTVLIFRRDTGSWINAFVGGRFFPGVHHRATFMVHQDAARVAIAMRSADGTHTIDVAANECDQIMEGSVFAAMEEVVRFFRGGENGYSPGKRDGEWEGVKLVCKDWSLKPMQVEHIAASFIEDAIRFPRGSAMLDSAFIMRDVEHEWTALPTVGWGRAPIGSMAQRWEKALT